jgi:Ca2+-binding EF-hand superfamily protein
MKKEDKELIISIKEARKIMGVKGKDYSDEYVRKLILEMDFLANLITQHLL